MSRPISEPKVRTKTDHSPEKVTGLCSPTTQSEREFTVQDECDLAYSFAQAQHDLFAGEPVPIILTATAVAKFMAGYLVQMPPADRVRVMSEMVDVMFTVIHDNPCTDILIN